MKNLISIATLLLLATSSIPALAVVEVVDVQSPHPYDNNMNETYEILALEGVPEVTIHFDYIDLELNYDYLLVKDEYGNPVTSLTGSHSDLHVVVPGDTATLQLLTDYSVTQEGFVVDTISYAPCACPAFWMPVCGDDSVTYGNACLASCQGGVSELYDGVCLWREVPGLIETPHPYLNNMDLTWDLQAAQPTTHFELGFDDFDLEEGYDFLYVSNQDGPELALTGELGAHEVLVEGEELFLEFQSDHSVTREGFLLSGYRWLDLDGVCGGADEKPTAGGDCCDGLERVSWATWPFLFKRTTYCVDCGDRVCGPYETKNSCPADCP